MKNIRCEEVLMAKMAEADGEPVGLLPAEIESHLSTCDDCRAELVKLHETDLFFDGVTRNEQQVDLWQEVSEGLTEPSATIGWKPFAVVGVLLLAYKLFELLPAEDPGMAFKLLPLIIFGCLILFLKENPFRINTELVMEK